MNGRSVKLATLALFALGSGTALHANATDVTVVNNLPSVIHPYFKSNCFGPTAKGWLFFGGIGPFSQFTWLALDQSMKCKHPHVKFTFALDGEAAPTGKGLPERVTRLELEPDVPLYTVTLATQPAIVDVTPDADNDADDDD